MQDSQAKSAFNATHVNILKEREIVSLKSDSKVGFNDFPDIGELHLRQNLIETEFREQITHGQTVASDQPVSHESVLH